MMKNKKITVIGIVLLISVLTAIVLIFFIIPSKNTKNKRPVIVQEESVEPKFRHDGELTFFHDKKTLHSISIEIADNDAERMQGLMYRESMPDSCGMLFIFEEMQPLSFWMKNTHFSLDIIYVDSDFTIVSIAKNTVPFSEVSIPSGKEAMYVVEVNAGFCDNHKIIAGNKIKYSLN